MNGLITVIRIIVIIIIIIIARIRIPIIICMKKGISTNE